jgi:hypothetical protein
MAGAAGEPDEDAKPHQMKMPSHGRAESPRWRRGAATGRCGDDEGVVQRAVARASCGGAGIERAAGGGAGVERAAGGAREGAVRPVDEHRRAGRAFSSTGARMTREWPEAAAATRCKASVMVAGTREAGGAVADAGDAGAAGAQGHHRLQGVDGGGAQVGRRRPGEAGPAARASHCRGPAYKKDKPR